MKHFITLLMLPFWVACAGQVSIQATEAIDSLVIKNVQRNAKQTTMAGYRIQLFSGTERIKANEAKAKLLQLFPDAEVTFMYQAPHFKVRVGNYRSRLDAQQMFRELLPDFPQSFIVPDRVEMPPL